MKLRMEPGNIITFSVGVLFITAAVYVYTAMGAVIEAAREATAVVVEVVYETGSRKGRIHPVVRFKAADGREIVATLQQHQNVQPQQTVQVIYDARDPNSVELGTIERVKHRRVLFTAFAFVVGLVVCALGVGLDAATLEWRLRRRG